MKKNVIAKGERSKSYSSLIDGLSAKIRTTLGAMCTSNPSVKFFTVTDISEELLKRFPQGESMSAAEREDLPRVVSSLIYQMVKNGATTNRTQRVWRSPGRVSPALSSGKSSYGYRVGVLVDPEYHKTKDTVENDIKAAQAAFDQQKSMQENVVNYIKNAANPAQTMEIGMEALARMYDHFESYNERMKEMQTKLSESEEKLKHAESQLQRINKMSILSKSIDDMLADNG